MRLLVTRPESDAFPLAATLRAAGHEVLIEPLLTIRLAAEVPSALERAGALMFTSSNGVRAYCALARRRDLRAYAIGDRTAQALAEAGFGDVLSAHGDGEALLRLVVETPPPPGSLLVHISGSVVAGDLVGRLAAAGVAVDRAVLYEALAAQELSPTVRAEIAAGRIDAVLLYSPRTAQLFGQLVQAAGAEAGLSGTMMICLSGAVATAVENLDTGRVMVAARPTQTALLECLSEGAA